jgi:quercetin dioxygenase-like cupin family protein
MNRKVLLTTAISIGTFALLGGNVAQATPPSGANGQVVAFGTLPSSSEAATDAVKFQTTGPTDVVTQRLEILPGGTSGWHAHPGLALVTVVSGTITFHDATCDSTIYGATQSFIEPPFETGMVTNDSPTTLAVFYATYVIPSGSPARLDRPVPACGGNVAG